MIRITDHAVQRYRERVKPGITTAQAQAELASLTNICPIREGTPAWLRSAQRSLFHLDAGTVMVALDPDPADVSRLMARTVLTTGCFRSCRRRESRRQRTAPALR
ncbi:hypothetical protein [Capillimicrobium parvum]|uniref:hypothetical protein n=1 Tax=Capillimicrobium parvum TaxID=2884022 RepID=UPI00216B1F48|nr:hypothetical protein [Capillimicrobium parvum]